MTDVNCFPKVKNSVDVILSGWFTINKPQSILFLGDTCPGHEVVSWMEVPLYQEPRNNFRNLNYTAIVLHLVKVDAKDNCVAFIVDSEQFLYGWITTT